MALRRRGLVHSRRDRRHSVPTRHPPWDPPGKTPLITESIAKWIAHALSFAWATQAPAEHDKETR